MHEKEIVADHMKIGSQFREGLRRHMDHEHLGRAERILNDTLSELRGGPVIHKENYHAAIELMEKHSSWLHLPLSQQEAFKTAIQNRIGIKTDAD